MGKAQKAEAARAAKEATLRANVESMLAKNNTLGLGDMDDINGGTNDLKEAIQSGSLDSKLMEMLQEEAKSKGFKGGEWGSSQNSSKPADNAADLESQIKALDREQRRKQIAERVAKAKAEAEPKEALMVSEKAVQELEAEEASEAETADSKK